MSTSNITALLIAVALIIGAIIYLDRSKAAQPQNNDTPVVPVALPEPPSAPAAQATENSDKPSALQQSLKEMRYERAKEITTPDGFINSLNPKGSAESMTIGEFVGKKVVLLDIWTYSCINCQRTIPYLNSWWEKYKDKGLVIIGLHTPEFEFEKKYENVAQAVKKFGIEYPVVLDNDYSTWRAYRNQYWPRKYLIDIDGYIVYDHIGEGAYEETERQIQKALAERMARSNPLEADSNGQARLDVPLTKETAVPRAGSPETYFGAWRNENFGNGARGAVGEQSLAAPEDIARNTLYLVGDWTIAREYAENKSANAQILFKYRAAEVYLVASSEKGVSAKIYIDGVLVRGGSPERVSSEEIRAGADVSADGTVFIKDDQLYRLILHQSREEHLLKIEIESPGLKAFTFTFG